MGVECARVDRANTTTRCGEIWGEMRRVCEVAKLRLPPIHGGRCEEALVAGGCEVARLRPTHMIKDAGFSSA